MYQYDSYRTSFFAFLTTPLRLALVTVDDGDPRHLVRGIVLVLAALRHFEAAFKTAAHTKINLLQTAVTIRYVITWSLH